MIPRYLVNFDLEKLPHVYTDVIVIGAGIAGLFTALKASEKHRVLMVTKKSLLDSNTRYAQGGIAAVISDEDSPAYHRQDTLIESEGMVTIVVTSPMPMSSSSHRFRLSFKAV